MYDRRNVSARKFNRKGGRGKARCDLCELRTAEHLHEIITRGQTVGNEDARNKSFAQELTSILCAECHINIGHTTHVRDFLYLKNMNLYGEVSVRNRWLEVRSVLRVNLEQTSPLPEWDSKRFEELQLLYHLQAHESPVDIEASMKLLRWSHEEWNDIFGRLIEKGEIGIESI